MTRYNSVTRSTTSSELRRNLAATLDRVAEDHAPVLVTRDGGKAPCVLISLEDFSSFEETHYLLSSPANRERLLEAVASLDQGQGRERELNE